VARLALAFGIGRALQFYACSCFFPKPVRDRIIARFEAHDSVNAGHRRGANASDGRPSS